MQISEVVERFERNISDVEMLIQFDDDVLGVVIKAVESLQSRLIKQRDMDNEQLNGGRVLTIIRGIRENKSLKPRYALILNQAVVLLVSYFASAIEDIFKLALRAKLRSPNAEGLLKEDIRLTVAELLEVASHHEDAVSALLIEKKDLSFQDMQAIHRAFREYIGIDIPKDQTVNNIILAQACRHVIVHVGGRVTPRLIRQVKGAHPRDLKEQFTDGEDIQFSQSEVKLVAKNMKIYVSALAELT